MIKWLARLLIVWVAIIFVARANEEILYGWQQLGEASNEAASATTTRHAAFPPIERESRIADNAPNTGKKARLQTDDDNLLTIGLGTTGAYPSYPSSFGLSSRSGEFKSNDHWLFPSGVGLEQYVNSQASSRTERRNLLSDLDKPREMDASASTKHYIPSPTYNSPESFSEPFNLGRKTHLQSDAPITRGPLGNSVTHEQDGGRGTQREIRNSWGYSLSLKTGVTSDENDAQDRYATREFLSGFPSIATPQFIPEEIQRVIWNFHLGSNTPSYQNSGPSMAPVWSAGGRIPWEMSSTAGQDGGNVLKSLKPPDQGENVQSWGADQGTTSSPRSQPKHSLRADIIALVDLPRLTEPLFNQAPRPQHHALESGNQASSSEDPEHIPQVLKMQKPHQRETIMAIKNHPSQIDGRTNYGRLKFNTDLFMSERPSQSGRIHLVQLLDSLTIPFEGNFLLTDYQLVVACQILRSRRLSKTTLSMPQIQIFMDNIHRWYQYWNTNAKIDLKSLNNGKVLRCEFVLPLFLLYVEMIISIIPFKQELPLNVELDYPQEMRNAIKSFMELNKILNNPPENGEYKFLMEKRKTFKVIVAHARSRPSAILWTFLDFWMKSHYTAVWNKVKEFNDLHSCDAVKTFFNYIFTRGIETLNQKIRDYLPHE